MRIIGIDPGIERTGFAIVEMGEGVPQILDYGDITTDRGLTVAERLVCLATDMKVLVRHWRPQAAAIEQVFFSKNVKTAMTVSHARGVILELLEEHGVPVQEFNPAHVKIAVTGTARADKIQIKKMVEYLTGVRVASDDSADALACALCVRSL